MEGVIMAQGVNVYLQADVIAQMQSRNTQETAIGWFANREIERLYALYSDAINDVKLTTAEACLIVDMLNATMMDERSARMLWAEADDAIRLDGLDKKWNVDGNELVVKLRSLTTIQAMAFVDASDRFWCMDAAERNADMIAAVKKCFRIKE
jgi:hypothetical protein